MAKGPLYRVAFRRRREGKTDYRRRLALLKSEEARVVVRRSSKNVIVQFIEFAPEGDRIIAQAESQELDKKGWKGAGSNMPAAYLAAYLAGVRAKAAGVEYAVLDLGLQVPHKGGLIFAALKGALDSGIEIPHGDDILPDESRVRGEHIKDGALTESFEATKNAIAG